MELVVAVVVGAAVALLLPRCLLADRSPQACLPANHLPQAPQAHLACLLGNLRHPRRSLPISQARLSKRCGRS